MRSIFDQTARNELSQRLRSLTADRPRLWGRMSAPQMVAHLGDQMRHMLGDVAPDPVRSPLRLPILRELALYVIPWPKGRVQGPPSAFVTKPAEWASDIEFLVSSLDRAGHKDPDSPWPDHAIFGRMRGRDWGYFCYRHFDHHLRQFGE